MAADVCRALEVKNARDAVARLDDDEKNTVVLTDGNRGNPNVTVAANPGCTHSSSAVASRRRKSSSAGLRTMSSHILVNEMAKLLRQNGVEIGEKKLFKRAERRGKALPPMLREALEEAVVLRA